MSTDRAAVHGLSGRLFEAVETRLALFGFELGEERDRFLASLVVVLVAVVLVFCGLIALNVFLVLMFWEDRLLVCGLLAGGYLGLGVILAMSARAQLRNAGTPFEATITELRKDAELLSPPRSKS